MAGGTEQQIFRQWPKQPLVVCVVYECACVCVCKHMLPLVATSLCQASSSWPGTELGGLEVHRDFALAVAVQAGSEGPTTGLSLTKETTD